MQGHDCTAYRMEEFKTFPLNLWEGMLLPMALFVLGFGLTTSFSFRERYFQYRMNCLPGLLIRMIIWD